MSKEILEEILEREMERIQQYYPEFVIRIHNLQLVVWDAKTNKYYHFHFQQPLTRATYIEAPKPDWWDEPISLFVEDEFSEDQIAAALDFIQS